MQHRLLLLLAIFYCLIPSASVDAQTNRTRNVTGVVVTQQNELLPGVNVTAIFTSGARRTTVSDAEGRFSITGPSESLTLKFERTSITPLEIQVALNDRAENLRIKVELLVPTVHESVVIEATALEPAIDRRNDTVYRETLFARDDQLIETLAAGINAGQHEGGGKSLEVRRFGFNLDHGGVNGGLKVLVDDVQQNQGTQGHGQGYLGQLKSLTPELVEGIDILNGPFSAQYGDFSGLGVVHIRTRESLPEQLTLRVQGGSFDTFRTFLAYSPDLRDARALIAYEGSRTDGPFLNPLRYKRDNVTGNYTRRLDHEQSLGFKFNFGRNDFFSSGQIPLDEVAAGRLDRFGFVDPFNGGRVRTGVAGIYYKRDFKSGDALKLDAFIARSLFDLYSNFTFFLNDTTNGDEIQQHDSRLQQGVNGQYLRPHKLFGRTALLTVGGNFHANQINVGLYNTVARNPLSIASSAHADVTNAAGYAQQALDLMEGRLHLEGGLRFDYFRFSVADKVNPLFSGTRGAGRLQPKATVAFIPFERHPATLYLNYGRGISSQDARGVVRGFTQSSAETPGPPISTTDFYQLGGAYNGRRLSLSADLFLIDRSNEQVYIPDDGSIEFAGPSRANGFELKASVQLTHHLTLNGGVTKVMNAFYRGTSPRVYVDSAPHVVGNAGLTFAGGRGLFAYLSYRHTSNYRLDGEDRTIRAAGLDVVDLSLRQRIRRWVAFNFAVDNLLDKHYFETQNYFESRLSPDAPIIARIHGTPGYSRGVTAGLTFTLGKKN